MTASTQTKGMCIATRCTSVEQFVQMFHRFVDEDSFFVSTINTRPAGLETAFSVQLADGTPVLRGQCIVLQSWSGSNSPFKTPGVRLGILRLTASSMPVFEQLLITRSAPTSAPLATPSEGVPTKLATPPRLPPSPTIPTPKTDEERTPGSDLVLPANPLSGINDVALEGFVDCTLYEETGNFFPVDEVLSAPPVKRTTIPPPMQIVNAPVEMSVLAPLPRSGTPAPLPIAPTPPMALPVAAAPGTLTSSTMPPAMISLAPVPTTPPPIMLVAPAAPPPIPMMARGTPMPDMTPTPFTPPITPSARAPRAPTETVRGFTLPPRRYLIAAGVTVLGIATVAIAASGGDDKPTAKKQPEKVVAQLETPKPMNEVVEPPPPAPAQPAMQPAEDADAPTNDAPAVIGDGPCKLEVATTPAGSMVSLDGKVLAPSPLTLATTCERHKLDIAHARYMTSTKFVSLTKPDDKVDVTLGRPTHMVVVTSQPSGATIFIDGHRAGTTPTTLSVMGFQNVKLEVKKTGYQPLTTKIYSKVPTDKVALKLSKW